MNDDGMILKVRRAAGAFLERVKRSGLTKRRAWLVATGLVAGLAALRRRPWLAGTAALAGVVAARVLKPSRKPSPDPSRGRPKVEDATHALDPDVTVTSMGYPAPPTVTVGPAATPST